MPTVDLGKIKLNWRGPYNSETQYEADDVVSSDGSSFICVASAPVTGTAPVAEQNTSTWEVMAAGVSPMDAQGQIVYQGATGPEKLAPGTSGRLLTTRGAGADPEWALPVSRQNSKVILLPATDHIAGSYRSGGFVVADGTPRAWGRADNGNLGTGEFFSNRSTPVMPAIPRTTATITKWRRCGEDNWVVMSDGSVYVWGRNSYGSLGVGNTAVVTMPTKVVALDGVNIVDIAVGAGTNWPYNHAMFLANDGTMYACGYNGHGQLGLGDNTVRNTPTALTKTDWVFVKCAGTQYARTHAIDTSGNLYSWGYQNHGELGDSTTNVEAHEPQQVTLPANASKVSACEDEHPALNVHVGGHTLVLLTDGRVYSFGLNAQGQLGLGDNNNRSTPHHVSSLGTNNVEVFAAGGHWGFSVVQKSDGTIRTFGLNQSGQLGDGTSTNRNSPITPTGIEGRGGILKVLPFGGQTYNSIAVAFNDGSLMTVGYNANGNLGVGSTTNQTTFQDVPLMKDEVEDICCVGVNNEVGLGILTNAGIYYQTGYAGESQLPKDDNESSAVPMPVVS